MLNNFCIQTITERTTSLKNKTMDTYYALLLNKLLNKLYYSINSYCSWLLNGQF